MTTVVEHVAASTRSFTAVFRNPALRRINLALAASVIGDWAYSRGGRRVGVPGARRCCAGFLRGRQVRHDGGARSADGNDRGSLPQTARDGRFRHRPRRHRRRWGSRHRHRRADGARLRPRAAHLDLLARLPSSTVGLAAAPGDGAAAADQRQRRVLDDREPRVLRRTGDRRIPVGHRRRRGGLPRQRRLVRRVCPVAQPSRRTTGRRGGRG